LLLLNRLCYDLKFNKYLKYYYLEARPPKEVNCKENDKFSNTMTVIWIEKYGLSGMWRRVVS
jgi:hypothetical protein